MRINVSEDEITRKIEAHLDKLHDAGLTKNDVSPEELVEYFSGDTPTGDKTTLRMVLDNPWILLHELVEIQTLKKMGLKITRHLLWDNQQEVYEAHLIAFEIELAVANKHGDNQWIERRIQLIPSWIEDSSMPPEMRLKYQALLRKYSH